MLDTLMGYYAAYRFGDTDESYDPSMAVESSKLTNEDGAFLTVLFPPWRGAEGIYNTLANRLEKTGSAVLSYNFHRQILEPDVQKVLDSFEVIKRTVAGDVAQLVKNHSYKEVHLIASSLGNVSMTLVASELRQFDSATMVVPGSSLARGTWEGSRTQAIRRAFEEQGIDDVTLDEEWASIAPEHGASSFAGKPVHMLISTSDKIIPARYQQKMVDSMLAAGARLNVSTHHVGHIATIFNYCQRGSLPH